MNFIFFPPLCHLSAFLAIYTHASAAQKTEYSWFHVKLPVTTVMFKLSPWSAVRTPDLGCGLGKSGAMRFLFSPILIVRANGWPWISVLRVFILTRTIRFFYIFRFEPGNWTRLVNSRRFWRETYCPLFAALQRSENVAVNARARVCDLTQSHGATAASGHIDAAITMSRWHLFLSKRSERKAFVRK